MYRQRNRADDLSPDTAEFQRRHYHDKDIFHRLLDYHQLVERSLEKLPNGIRSVTRSADTEVVTLLHEHVPAMHQRLQEGFSLRRWDPLYKALFEHADDIIMEIRPLPDGVEVIKVTDDPAVIPLLHAHGDSVGAFVKRGHAAAAKVSRFPEDAP